jgi:WhiB family transcriptional regulator, redox-sensing transcriptional regulator
MEFPNFSDKGVPLCATVENPNMFNHEEHVFGAAQVIEAAKEVCNTPCPYKDECLLWAMTHGETGVWGGTSERDRKRMKRAALPMPSMPASRYS